VIPTETLVLGYTCKVTSRVTAEIRLPAGLD